MLRILIKYLETLNAEFKRHIVQKLRNESMMAYLSRSKECKERIEYLMNTVNLNKAAARYNLNKDFLSKMARARKKKQRRRENHSSISNSEQQSASDCNLSYVDDGTLYEDENLTYRKCFK